MYLEVLEHEERFNLQFQILNGYRKGIIQAFSSYKLTRKWCMIHLKIKLQQDRRR